MWTTCTKESQHVIQSVLPTLNFPNAFRDARKFDRLASDNGSKRAARRHSLLRRRRPEEERFQNRGRIVNQRLLVSIEHLVAHRRGEGLGSALAASPQHRKTAQDILRRGARVLINQQLIR